MNKAIHALLLTAALALVACAREQPTHVKQIPIPRVEQMPRIPKPFKIRDWQATARAFDRLAFDFEAHGEHLPLIWWDDSRTNTGRRTFGLPSYVGTPNATGPNHEGITCMGAVLGATVAGIDKAAGAHNWVLMCEEYFNKANGQNVVLNRTSAPTGSSFWYELWPGVLFAMLADCYPQLPSMQRIVRIAADRWHDAALAMKGNFDHTAFNLKTMAPADNGRWAEPDAAAGIAWLQYTAYARWGDPKHLDAATRCLRFLDARARTDGALYEVLMPFGALAAARANAELGHRHDVDSMLAWCFEGTNPSRWGWGITAERWGTLDCHGLQGSIIDGRGYAFAMSTFAFPAALVPLARYDPRYARAIGRYVLNAASAARLFYPDEHPPDRQTSPQWTADPAHCIPYEGLRASLDGGRFEPYKDKLAPQGPYALGDALKNNWGPKTDLGLYGGCLAGLFAGLIERTSHDAILRLDCLATDFFRAPAYPTFLYYNPYGEPRQVALAVDRPADLYDAVTSRFLHRGVAGTATFPVPADGAVLLVVLPAGSRLTFDGRKTLVRNVVIDYNNGRVPIPPPDRPSPIQPDQSRAIDADRATPAIDGDPADWADLASTTLHLHTAGRGSLACTLRFAWDERCLYLLAAEKPGDTTQREAGNPLHFERSPWDFDGLMLFIDLDNSNTPEPHAEFNACLGFSSARRTDLLTARTNRPYRAFRPNRRVVPRCRVATGGTFAAKNRTIEAAIAWRDLAEHALFELPSRQPLAQAVRPGFRFGCEPLLLDDGWRKQAHIGGAQHQRPSGSDPNSIDIILKGP